MAQAIADIKAGMTIRFMANQVNADAYGFTVGDDFETTFSKVSFESIMFDNIAYSMWLVQKQSDTDQSDTAALIDTKKPHRLKWYRDQALAFRFGRALVVDTDVYDLSGIDDLSTIANELVVQYASAFEYQGKLFIKVSGGTSTAKTVLTTEQYTALVDYFEEIKDAGVRIVIVNEAADHFASQLIIYYDPLVLYGNGMHLNLGTYPVVDAINDFVQNKIPFNGEYRNMALLDMLVGVTGVVIPELTGVQGCSDADFQKSGADAFTAITSKAIPDSGYYKIYNPTDLNIIYKAYQTIESV